MKEPDREQFLAAIDKECEAHFKEGNYKLVKRSNYLREPLYYPVYGK
jgi:hypothetical protein